MLMLSPGAALASGEARAIVAPGSRLYVEPFDGDKFSLRQRVETELLKYGYRVVVAPEKADFRVKWSYTHGTSTYASVQVIDRNDEVVHYDEGKNPGFGTIINKAGSTWGCVRRALDGLEP